MLSFSKAFFVVTFQFFSKQTDKEIESKEGRELAKETESTKNAECLNVDIWWWYANGASRVLCTLHHHRWRRCHHRHRICTFTYTSRRNILAKNKANNGWKKEQFAIYNNEIERKNTNKQKAFHIKVECKKTKI